MANKVEIIINADGSRAIKAMQDVGATARATGKANDEAAKATALAAKFAGDSVSAASVKIIEARERERTAAKDYAQIQALLRKGSIDEATGVTVAAAAYHRLTLAKIASAEASEKHLSAIKNEGHEWATLRERLGGGLSAAGSFAGNSIPELAAFAGAAGALEELKSAVTETLEFGEAMKRASEKTGLAVGTLSVLHYASAVTGGDFDTMTAAVAKMDKTIGQATEGNKRAGAFLKSLGLDAKALADSPDGAQVAFQKFAVTLAATENPIRRVQLATALLGKAGAEQIPTLIEVGAHLDEWTQKAKDAGRYMTQLSAEQLAEVNEKLKALQEHIDGAKVALAEGFTPALSKMIDVIEGGNGPMDSMNTLGQNLGKTFAFFGETVYTAAAGLEGLFGIMEALIPGAGDAARRDLAAFQPLLDKAQKMHDIAFGANPAAPSAFDERMAEAKALAGATGTHHGAGTDEGFGGVGDLSTQRNPDAARFKADEAELNQRHIDLPDDKTGAKSDYDFWEQKKATYKAGSDQYNEIVAKQAALAEEGAKRAHSMIEELRKKQLRDDGEDALERMRVLAEGNKGIRAMQKQLFDDQQASGDRLRALVASQQDANFKVSEFRVQNYGASAGNNARELASLHQQQYAAAQANLAVSVSNAQLDPYTTDKERDEKLQRLQEEQSRLAKERELQAAEDQKRIESTTLLGGANEALRDFILSATNGGAALQTFLTSSIGTVNGEIVKALTTPAHHQGGADFAAAGHAIFTQATGSLLKGAEGSLLKGLGIGGKKDGSSAANALWVRDAAAATRAIGSPVSAIPGIGGIFAAGAGAASASSATGENPIGNDVSKIASFALHLIPGFADGGEYPTNSLIQVGERGPEIMRTGRTPGTIIPNHALGGTTLHNNINVDARGATNPAEVEAAGFRGALRAAPMIHQAVLQSVNDNRLRRPHIS